MTKRNKIGLIIIKCEHCGYPQYSSEDSYWLRLQISCESCERFFSIYRNENPIFISSIYNYLTENN